MVYGIYGISSMIKCFLDARSSEPAVPSTLLPYDMLKISKDNSQPAFFLFEDSPKDLYGSLDPQRNNKQR